MVKDIQPISQRKNLIINIGDQVKSGVYSNLVVVTTTSNREVLIDFIFAHPNDKDGENSIAQVVSRVILPVSVAQDMKLIMESQLGKIKKE